MLQNGIWFSPQTERLFLISKDIFKNPFLNQTSNQWLMSSFLGPVLGYITSANQSLILYSLLHLVILLICFTALTIIIRRQYGDFVARSVLIVFFLSPISNVLFTWLGSPDILTFILVTVLVIFRKNIKIIFVSSFLLGINHPEQGLIVLFLLAVFSYLINRKRESILFVLFGIGSLLLGKYLLEMYFDSQNMFVEFSRIDYIPNAGLLRYIRATLSNPFALLFSLYNVLYVFIIVYVVYYWKREKIAIAFIVYSILAFITILITLDQTRVFSILTFPVLLLLVFSPSYQSLGSTEKNFFKNVLALSFIAGIIVPRFLVWEGNVYYSAYKNILNLFINLMS